MTLSIVLQFAVVLAAIWMGARFSGVGLGLWGAVGLLVLVVAFGVSPTSPPVDVMLIILAVIMAASVMDAAGGIDFLVRVAERIIRANPKYVTIVAPLTTWTFTFVAGTGHIVYPLLPVIYETAHQSGIRPERPMAVATIASQQAITASPVAAATAAMIGLFSEKGLTQWGLPEILMVADVEELLASLGGEKDRPVRELRLLAAEREARARSLDLVGIYHSHPDCDAYFSETDLKNSCPWYSFVVLSIRKGHLTGSRDYGFRNEEASPSEVMEAFVKQYYPREAFIPKVVLLSTPIEDQPGIEEWVSELAGKRIFIECPSRGEKARLTKMAVANADNLLKSRVEPDLVSMTQEVLKLKKPPRTMEAVDISNISGDMAVGAVVSFVDGEPHRAGYRNFRIKTVEGIDDYGMMAELISRRLSKDPVPDLLVVDGGKGHLMAVKRVVDAHRTGDPPDLVAIAKANQDEEADKVFVPANIFPNSKDNRELGAQIFFIYFREKLK